MIHVYTEQFSIGPWTTRPGQYLLMLLRRTMNQELSTTKKRMWPKKKITQQFTDLVIFLFLEAAHPSWCSVHRHDGFRGSRHRDGFLPFFLHCWLLFLFLCQPLFLLLFLFLLPFLFFFLFLFALLLLFLTPLSLLLTEEFRGVERWGGKVVHTGRFLLGGRSINWPFLQSNILIVSNNAFCVMLTLLFLPTIFYAYHVIFCLSKISFLGFPFTLYVSGKIY